MSDDMGFGLLLTGSIMVTVGLIAAGVNVFSAWFIGSGLFIMITAGATLVRGGRI